MQYEIVWGMASSPSSEPDAVMAAYEGQLASNPPALGERSSSDGP